ncbi:MAG TPA: GNAT family N-acetyltransferase [Candidatus Mcinerneyibacteriales bacterium]|nr:GNAT family N-acetyltransferase [Candidatus Mcinerneyibacteriales bacterium]HPE19898.1 GNAT family N-acetyltransferase [Candidatus Mcinerneyibacteriales bacterium]HPJ70302.1 GNAT family N-acetyltransferase [Candidatus Mcinerneyibacteriales bacterium]HPQ88820.1 GNAT family N-acetyltransferase [Candidatus Mcinerneyibacteriales bacterium]
MKKAKESDIRFAEISRKNVYDIMRLSRSLPPEQQNLVAPNAVSIVEGIYTPNSWFRGIYERDIPVGFIMLSFGSELDSGIPNKNDVFLWRYMIAASHQGRNIGLLALKKVIQQLKESGYLHFYTSCSMDEGSPYPFYLKCGFIDTGKTLEDEQLLKLDLCHL